MDTANASALGTSRISWLYNDRIPARNEMRVPTYLGWYVVVKVPGVLRIVKFWTEQRGITINVGPINSME